MRCAGNALQSLGDEAMLFPLPAELLGCGRVAPPSLGADTSGARGHWRGPSGFIAGNATQPGRDTGRRREHRGALPDHEQDLIDDVIHEGGGAKVAPEKPPGGA